MKSLRDIKQTKEAKKAYEHPIIDFLLGEEPKTKEEIGQHLHITSEREIRNIIAICSMHYAVIATSDKKGYRRAKPIESLQGNELLVEMDEVMKQIRELNSRIRCLKKRVKPLIAWLKVAEKKLEANKEVQEVKEECKQEI